MALTPEQYETADSELRRIHEYLIGLAVQIEATSANTDKRCFTSHTACRAGDAIAHLRYILAQQQEYMREGEKIRRRLGKQ